MKKVLAMMLTLVMVLGAFWAVAVPASADGILYGDANKDGNVNMKDVLMVRKYVAGIEVDIDLVAADVNGDEVVNMKDVLTERKFVANIIDVMPAAEKEPTYDPDTIWLLSKVTKGNDVIEEYTYDENGNMIIKAYPRSNFYYEFVYDENGNKIASRSYRNGELEWISENTWDATYDTDGKLLTELHRNADDSIDYWIEYAYDEQGHTISSRLYLPDGTMKWTAYKGNRGTWDKTYDIYGHMITQSFYLENGVVAYTDQFLYDDDGNLRRMENLRQDGSVLLFYEYSYDENGHLLTSRQYNGTTGNLEWNSDHTFDQTYDAYGNLITKYRYMSARSGDLYKYEYIPFKPAQE